MSMNHYVTIDDIRHYVLDRSAEDNLDEDLEFSDPDVETAMKAAAREYNGIDPFTDCVEPNRLPANTNIFFDGIIAHLYTMKMHQDMRNDVEYQAGGVASSETQRRITHFRDLVKYHRELFRTTAQKIKANRNIHRGYGAIG